MSKIVIISGNPQKGSRFNGLVQYVEDALKEKGQDVETLHVVDLPAEDLIHARFGSEAILAAHQKIEAADAVVIASPIYKASFTGVLKTYLDLLPQYGFQDKTVMPLALGGTLAHFLAVDISYKSVAATLGSRKVLNGVFTLDSGVKWNEQGTVDFDEKTQERIDRAVQELIDAVK